MFRFRVRATARLLERLAPLIVMAACGCADVRVVRETPDGGVLALPMNSNCWPMYYRDRAEKLMIAKCPDGYLIDREEPVWDGKEGTEGHRAYESYFGYTDPDDENAPYLRKEYHITFHASRAGNRPKSEAPGKPAEQGSPAPPAGKGEEELPSPRPLKDLKDAQTHGDS